MPQFYSNPIRETDPHALPDAEVFYLDSGEMEGEEPGEWLPAGWYWWACFPGCLPDGDPVGPFDSEEDAIEDCQSSCFEC